MSIFYTEAEELLSDESFLEWHYKKNPDSTQKWENFIKENPDKLDLIHQAETLLSAIAIVENPMPDSQIINAEAQLFEAIEEKGNEQTRVTPVLRKRWWMAAAAILIVAAGLYYSKIFVTSKDEIKTVYGQISKQNLPDGTEVMLNANSQISFDYWGEGEDREVWIKGEAFFKVKKTPQKSRFIVHTQRFDIIVTGTQFNVVNRDGVTNVMLKEGSVILRTKEGKEIKMLPGDFVEFTGSKPEKKAVKSENILAWTDKKLIFENTPLREALKKIREHYNVSISLGDPSIGDKPITGILPNDNLEVLLQSLEATMDFKVIRNNNEIIITNP